MLLGTCRHHGHAWGREDQWLRLSPVLMVECLGLMVGLPNPFGYSAARHTDIR
jgi:hypothetical protein